MVGMNDKITSVEQLERLYGTPVAAATVKVADRITPDYRRLIEASPFCALATTGPEGLDCSPRGDQGSCLHIEDERTLILPDRLGNNRIDSLRNIVRDPRVALLLLIPGSGTTLRINGHAELSVEPAALKAFEVKGKQPRCFIKISVTEIYFQCARAVIRADLWNPNAQIDPSTLPTPGQILSHMSDGETGGNDYDREWPERASRTMW